MDSSSALIKPEERQRLSISMSPRGIQFNSFEDLYRFAVAASDTQFVPKDLQGKPMAVLVAMEFCLEIGLPILAGIRNVAVINGRPSMWGDALVAMVKGSGLMEYDHHDYEGEPGTDGYRAVYISKRRGYPQPSVSYFSIADAKRAKLWGKPGPWTEHPDRMLLSRARGFQLRDDYADALMGLTPREEAEDIDTEPTALPPMETPRPLPDAAADGRPTLDQIRELQANALASGIPKESLAGELRRFFHIPGNGRLTQAALAEALTVADVERGMAHYTARLRAVVEADIDDFAPAPVPTPEPPAMVAEAEMTRLRQWAFDHGVADAYARLTDGYELMTVSKFQETESSLIDLANANEGS